MIEVKIPSDIQAYKSKLIAGLSVRQVIAIAGALVTAVPIGVFGRDKIPADYLLWIIILAVTPFAGYGFLNFQGMPFEQFVVVMFNHYLMPQKRVYEDTDANLFSELSGELTALDILQQRIDAGEYEETGEQEWRGTN